MEECAAGFSVRYLDRFYDQDADFHSPPDNLENAWRTCLTLVSHLLDVWQGFGHDWPWWQYMARTFFA